MARVDQEQVSVLIVDDEPEVAETYATMLEMEGGFSTAILHDGQEALTELANGGFDVVLLDRRMPGLSGDEVLTELRANDKETPVAMLTAVEPDEDILTLPFDEYLTKPISRDSLVGTIQILANRAQFKRTSRKFFRLAAKRASLKAHSEQIDMSDAEPGNLVQQLDAFQDTLDETIDEIMEREAGITERIKPEEEEVWDLIAEVGDHPLPDPVRELIEEYQALQAARPPFMWKWVHRLAPQNQLGCVPTEYRSKVDADKTITILFITILDDLLEKQNDHRTFHEVTKIPFPEQPVAPTADGVQEDVIRVADRVWSNLHGRLESAPRYATYEDLLLYDLQQAIDAIRYSELALRRPDLSTMTDLRRYESHNMVMMAYANIDLMHSSVDLSGEFGTIREAVWTAQMMARIGNWVSTWERELREGDFSAGPIVAAIERGVVTVEQVKACPTDETMAERVIDRIAAAGIEKEFLTEWERNYHRLAEYEQTISSIDLGSFVSGTEEVLRYHLASRGLK